MPGPNREKAERLSVELAIPSPKDGPLGPVEWNLNAVERLLKRIEALEESVKILRSRQHDLD